MIENWVTLARPVRKNDADVAGQSIRYGSENNKSQWQDVPYFRDVLKSSGMKVRGGHCNGKIIAILMTVPIAGIHIGTAPLQMMDHGPRSQGSNAPKTKNSQIILVNGSA